MGGSAKAAGRLRQKVGDANYWLEVEHLTMAWGLTRRAAFKALHKLRVPIVYFGSNAFFNSYALDKVLYYVTRHGGPGFAGPGTSAKRNVGRRNTISCVELSDQDLVRMEDPAFVAEWLTIRSRGKSATTLIRLLEKLGKNTEQVTEGQDYEGDEGASE